jgi:hypothetical protein
MELKNVNLDGDNIVARNLINFNHFYKNCENRVQKQRLCVIFS